MLENIEPQAVWKYFEKLCKIPRCSKHEKKVAEYILSVAKQHNLEAFIDENGNVIARKKANGYDRAPMIILQVHMDMVCEKNKEVIHDFNRDSIEQYVEGEWMMARGTTLGADNGVGVALCLAIMEAKNIKHGPIEFLFTVDEETGLTGAFRLKKKSLTGKLLINLDSEDFGVIFIGCAGGGDTNVTLPLIYEKKSEKGYRIAVKGLKGGHSGIEIDKGRANALKLLIRVIRALDARIQHIEGGDKHNAIPREANAEIMVRGDVINTVKKLETAFKNEYGKIEPGLKLDVEPCEITRVLSERSNKTLVGLVMGLPHGVLAMSQDVGGLVETSTNLATIRMDEKVAIILTSSRSSIGTALESVRQSIACIAELAGATAEQGNAYPGWQPNLDSRLLKIASDAFKDLFGIYIEKKAIHAGLETGVIGEITGITEIISIGPQIEHPHSPDERVNIVSTEKFWDYLKYLLEKIAKEW